MRACWLVCGAHPLLQARGRGAPCKIMYWLYGCPSFEASPPASLSMCPAQIGMRGSLGRAPILAVAFLMSVLAIET